MNDSRCRRCFEEGVAKLVRQHAPAARHDELIAAIAAEGRALPEGTPAPLAAALALASFSRLTGVADPFREERARGNALVLAAMPELRRRLAQAAEPLRDAVRMAMAGNVLDSAAPHAGSFHEALARLLDGPLAIDHLGALRERLAGARSLLYLADNAGEIVVDRLLLEQLGVEDSTVVVRGRPAWNDALLADAATAGLAEVARVVDNGDGAPGTLLDRVRPELRRLFAEADLVISKGQGNYETLAHERRPGLFFVLVAKCDVVSDMLGVARGGGILLHAPEHPETGARLGL